MLVNKIEVPPILTKGKGTPVTGIKFTATAMFAKACMTKLKLNPQASNAPKAFGALVIIRTDRDKQNR